MTNILIVAACLIAEAGGEGTRGMQAVREVIATRARERRQTEATACLARKQFSCFNGVPWTTVVERASRHPRWNEAVKLAGEPPATWHAKGANHYIAPKTIGARQGWWTGKKPVAVVGNHTFYKL